MASVDGSKPILYTSDELYEHVCSPCKRGNTVTEARHYCEDCNEYLCDACADYHQRLSVTANHKILSGSKLPSSTTKSGPIFAIYCSCHQTQPAEVYCEDHKDVVCMSCHTVKHRKCKTEKVQRKSAGYTSSKLDEIITKINSFKSEFDRLIKQFMSAAADLQSMRKSLEREIANFRKEMDIFLDSLEKTLLNKLDENAKEQQKIIDNHISSLTTASQMIDSNSNQLKCAKSDGRSATMFSADIQASKNLTEYDNLFREVENDYKEPQLVFEKNKTLESIQKDIDALGYITICYKEQNIKAQKMLKDMKVTSVKQVSIRLDDDRDPPSITGCTFMPNDYLVLCDYLNNEIKMLNSECKLVVKLQVKSGPWSLSAVGSDKVIITLPDKKQLQYVQVFPQMKCGTTIQLDKKCYGIAVNDNRIFVSCEANKKEGGDVRILDLNGTQERKIDLEKTGSLKYREPHYLSIDSINKIIFVSNVKNPASVTCLTFDGKVVYQCTSPKLKWVQGFYVDAGDNAYVCDAGNNNVHITANDGSHCGTLIGPEDGLKQRVSIAVRERDGTVVIGCWKSDNILFFHLS